MLVIILLLTTYLLLLSSFLGGGGLRGLGTGGRSGALRAGIGRVVPDKRRALVAVSMVTDEGRVGPVEDIEPVEA